MNLKVVYWFLIMVKTEDQFPDMGSFSLNKNFSYSDPLLAG